MERSDETTTGLVTPARVTTGGNMSAACIKQEPSSAFMPRKYVPDGRVYEGLYERGATLFMSPEQEKLYLDRLWLDAQANPERSLGDYLPDGMAKQLGRLHEALMPPFAERVRHVEGPAEGRQKSNLAALPEWPTAALPAPRS